MERRQSVFTDAWSDQDAAEYERERTKSARSSPINILTHGGEATWLQVFINLGLGFLAQLFLSIDLSYEGITFKYQWKRCIT